MTEAPLAVAPILIPCTLENGFGRYGRRCGDDDTSIVSSRSQRLGQSTTRYHASDYRPPKETASYTRNNSIGPLRSPTRHSKTHRQNSDSSDAHRLQLSSEFTDRKTRSYRLEIVQHPLKTAEFGTSTLSRLPLAPPLIAQLHVRDHPAAGVLDESELPFLIAHLSLYSADGSTPVDIATNGNRNSPERMLYGSLVSSPHVLRNLQGRQGVYFLFPDVSIRWKGRFQLSVTLMRISPHGTMDVDSEQGVALDRVNSHAFDVYARSDYVAPAQTPLTQYFLQQGARMTNSCARRPL